MKEFFTAMAKTFLVILLFWAIAIVIFSFVFSVVSAFV